ncbi:CatB-related O-acetyltransferase [Bacteroides faecichinchillae]|uniref:CatB-related O-acetyltransferase n=1 Tax=Bacteroides faecichinchillae TaxID=871325 RepID=UPI0035123A04
MIEYIISKFLKKARLAAVINSQIDKTSKVESGSHVVGSSFGKYSYCGYDCEILNSEIGSYVSIANNCRMGGASHVTSWVSTSPVFYKGKDSIAKKFVEYERPPGKKIHIGHDVWIGEGCIIKQGVTIGTGAVIGMGSIVTKDIPPYSIAAGNPARIIRSRFDEQISQALLESEWWNLSENELHQCAQFIQNPVEFLKAVAKLKLR